MNILLHLYMTVVTCAVFEQTCMRAVAQCSAGSVRQSAQEGKVPVLTLMVCQNYAPGDSSMAGAGFQDASIGLVPDGEGFLFHVVPR